MARNGAIEDWLIAVRAPSAGARRFLAALQQHGDMAAVRAAARMGRSGLPGDTEAYLQRPDDAVLAQDLAWLQQEGHHLLTWDDAWYPSLLGDTAGAPVALFVVGDPGVLWQPQIAVVGSRKATQSGLRHAGEFSAALARQGFVITSGLARGIDAAAHQAALNAGGSTVAVLGTGPDRVYPAENHALARRIAQNGALVTEYPPGTSSHKGHFPTRNRIISGLSLGVLVVEAGLKSGSLITARLAAEQGREVMAIPGNIDLEQARGCHQLIRDGARLVDCAGHIVEDVRPLAARLADHLRQAIIAAPVATSAAAPVTNAAEAASAPDPSAQVAALDEHYQSLLRALGQRPLAVDEIVEAIDLTPEAVSSMLLILELQGLVVCHSGGTWSRHHEIAI